MSPSVTVVIPNWNGAHLLPDCLGSLSRQTYRDFETIVVDNASTDASRELIRVQFPEVRVLTLPKNVFFAGAVNAGIRASVSEFVALLNNDTEAEPDWLAALVQALREHPSAGLAASKMLLYDRRDVLNSAGDLYRTDGTPGNRGVWEIDRGQYDGARLVFGACGGAALYRRAMLDDIGLFDEDFVGYCEDVDLNFRAQLAGYQCVFVPEARIYHRLSATGGGPIASFLCGRNFISVIVKDVPGPLLRRYLPRIIAAQLRLGWQSLRHVREPAARARLRGQLAALPALPAMLRKRRRIQAGRRVDLAYLEGLLSQS